jgi:hypothetical protein
MDQNRQALMQRADEIDEADGSPDELEELIAEMTAKDPDFPRMLEEAMERRELIHMLIQEYDHQQIPKQSSLLAPMDQSQRDPRISTLQRYAASMGKRLTWQLVDA